MTRIAINQGILNAANELHRAIGAVQTQIAGLTNLIADAGAKDFYFEESDLADYAQAAWAASCTVESKVLEVVSACEEIGKECLREDDLLDGRQRTYLVKSTTHADRVIDETTTEQFLKSRGAGHETLMPLRKGELVWESPAGTTIELFAYGCGCTRDGKRLCGLHPECEGGGQGVIET